MNKQKIIANAVAANASEEAATAHYLTLTIKVPITVYVQPSTPEQGFSGAELDKAEVLRLLTDDGYSDGRYPLDRETLVASVTRLVKQAIRSSLLNFWCHKHSEQVRIADNQTRNLGFIMAEVDSNRFSVFANPEIEFSELS